MAAGIGAAAAPSASAKSSRLAQQASQVVAFAAPGLALSLPSGYSIGPALLALCTLVFVRQWWGQPWDRRATLLAALLLIMGGVWSMRFDSSDLSMPQPGDRLAKYALVAACLGFWQCYAPRMRPIGWGLLAGSLGAGLLALWQVIVGHAERASGFTNAIQFSGIALVLALGCGLCVLLLWQDLRRWQRALGLAGALAGLLAVVLSDTRGSWVVLPGMLLVAAVPLWRCGLRQAVLLGLAAAIIGIGGIAALKGREIENRYDQAVHEVDLYQGQGQARTSVGQRLAHWKLAWQMGLDKPITGWGLQGYKDEKQRRVQAGLADPFVLEFGHAHNELLDTFAKRGLVGVALLLAFYAVPLAIFWPTRQRVTLPGGGIDRQALLLRMLGITLPLCYAGFGLTQVFFAHNSGHMFYMSMLVLLLAALIGRERSIARH